MNETIDNDPIERLAAYAPDLGRLAPEWSPAQARAAVLRAQHDAPRRPRRTARFPLSAAQLSAAAIAVVLVGSVATVVLSSGDDHTNTQPAAHDPYVPTSVVDTPRVGTDQFGYRATTTYDLTSGTVVIAKSRTWTAPDGSEYFWYDDSNPKSAPELNGVSCGHRHRPSDIDFATPTQHFFDQLPTDPSALESAMRAKVQGSTSQDEALFVATGDALREHDPLASATLRAAIVTVLSGLSRVSTHPASDYLGRAAVRLDFVDPANRGNSVQSLFFDASNFQLLEEGSGTQGDDLPYPGGASPAYTSAPGDQDTTGDTALPYLTVMTDESVTDAVPADILQCADH